MVERGGSRIALYHWNRCVRCDWDFQLTFGHTCYYRVYYYYTWNCSIRITENVTNRPRIRILVIKSIIYFSILCSANAPLSYDKPQSPVAEDRINVIVTTSPTPYEWQFINSNALNKKQNYCNKYKTERPIERGIKKNIKKSKGILFIETIKTAVCVRTRYKGTFDACNRISAH